jgi:hypothetical protein
MAAIQVSNIQVLNNPCGFLEPFQFEITFEASQQLQEDLEWRVTYVGSADSEEHDQVLDSVLVGPVPLGTNRFVFETPAPDPSKIPVGDLVGVTVVLVECLYRDKVFVRVGYYVSNENPDDPTAGGTSGTGDDGMEVEDIKSESEASEDEDEEEDMAVDDGTGSNENKQQQQSSAQSSSTKSQPHQQQQQQSRPAVNVDPAKIRRIILEDKPRVTRFPIDWDLVQQQQPIDQDFLAQQQQQQQQQHAMMGM